MDGKMESAFQFASAHWSEQRLLANEVKSRVEHEIYMLKDWGAYFHSNQPAGKITLHVSNRASLEAIYIDVGVKPDGYLSISSRRTDLDGNDVDVRSHGRQFVSAEEVLERLGAVIAWANHTV